MRRKLLYLINPISRTKKKPALRELISKKTTAAGFSFSIMDTRADGDYSYLPEHIAKEQINDVVICGGDGSVSTVASFLLHTHVAIGIIPMGSGNGLALAAGIPNNAARALDIIIKGHSDYIDGFLINNRFSCMMCGIGSDAKIAHEFAVQKKRGLKTYLRLSLRRYFNLDSYSFTIEIRDRSFSTDAFFIVIANSNQFGNHVTIAPKASLTDGLIDFVVVKKMNRLLLPFALLKQITGTRLAEPTDLYVKSNNIIYMQASEAIITNNNNAPLHIDGEPQPSANRIKIKILPKAFRLLQPSL